MYSDATDDKEKHHIGIYGTNNVTAIKTTTC
jgi:hypothetical protein